MVVLVLGDSVQTVLKLHLHARKICASSDGGGRVVRWCWINFKCGGVILILFIVGQGPTALTVGAGWGCLDIFHFISFLFSFSLSGRRSDIN